MHTLIRRSACFIAILLFSGLTMGVQPALAVDCSQAQINLTTQAEVDSFQADYGPGCDTVINGLIIDGASINDLTPLSDLTAVATIGPFYPTHQLLITNTSLTSLAGLENLANIFWLDLSNNNQLTSLAALSNLTLVRGPITISGSSVLTNVNGLGGVTALNGGALILRDNPLLSDLSGLSNLTTTGASLVINNNDSLQHVDGLSGLNFVASNISIGYNDGLLNIDGLVNIANFDATFDLRFNSQLVSIPTFTGWTDLFGLILYYNAELQHVDGLLGLETIGNQYSTMWIRNNAKLSSLDGLADLVVSMRGWNYQAIPCWVIVTG